MPRDSHPTALQILDDAKFEVLFGESHLVQAQGCGSAMSAGLKLIALEDLRNARRRIEQVERRVEDELYNRDQEEMEL